jgi:L-iditol 2-dehydrogenase
MTTLLHQFPIQTKMKAALFYQPGDVRYEEMDTPIPGPGEIVMKVEVALTCGTDVKTFRRGHPVLLKQFPSPFGHECAGVVAAVGEGVSRLVPGDRVVAANSAPCMHCYFCHRHHYNLCENLDLLNGAYAEYLKIPAQIVNVNTHLIPEGVPFEAAAFAEPLSVSMRGLDACRIRPGDTVAVIGLGAIGLFMVKLAKMQGAHVVAIGRNPLKRELARSFGDADRVLNFNDFGDPLLIKRAFTQDGFGFDVVVEAVGQPQTWEMAVDLARRGGLVNFFGGCESGSRITLDTRRLHYDEITLVSPFHHTPKYFKRALDWIATGKLDPASLITQRMPLADVVDALEQVATGKAIKVALFPQV